MKQSLYNIEQDQRYTLSEIEALGGELTPELEAQLEINAQQLQTKSIKYLEVIKTKDAYNSLVKEEIKRLQGIVKINDNLTTRLKDNLLRAVKTFGDFEAGFTKFSIRKSVSVKVMEDMINSLPKKYKTVKVIESADKKTIKKDLQDGIEIDGCELVSNDNLSIK